MPNPNYYGPKPQLKELIFPFYKEADTTRKDYLVNRLDDASIPLADYARTKHALTSTSILSLAINYYTMNYNQKPFDNVHIRQAFALAINKDILAKVSGKVHSWLPIISCHKVYGYNANLTGPAGVKGTSW